MLKLVSITFAACLAMVALMPGERGAQPETAAAAPSTSARAATAGNGFAGTTLRRSPDGHFYADAHVNGATIRFLVDSGASAVVLTRTDAQKAGIAAGPGDFTATATGAGGAVKLKPVTFDRIAVGPISADRVAGAVAEDGLEISLLGQTFLSRISHLEIADDEMRLR